MPGKKSLDLRPGLILMAVVALGWLAACSQTETEPPTPEGVQTQLLVTSPSQPLPVNQPVTVISKTEDAKQQVSHVELYAVKWPSQETEAESGQGNELLLRSDAVDFAQTVFTAHQQFVPAKPGLYEIKVVGYNKLGHSAQTASLTFEVE
jgi:hypothetical protein